MPDEPRKHHLVTKAVQKHFARDGTWIYLIDKGTSTAELQSVTAAFWEWDFNSWSRDEWNRVVGLQSPSPTAVDTTLETDFSKIEGLAIPRMRRLLQGQDEPGDDEAVRALAAIHHARSSGFRDFHEHFLRENREAIVADIMAQSDAMTTYRSRAGRPVADALGDDVMNIADSFFVNAVRQLHNRAVEQFRCMHLSLVFAPPGYSFVYGDSPVIFTNNTAQGYKVGLREGAKWGREHTKQLVWPISRNTMSVLSWEPAAPRILTPRECVQLNQLQLRTTGRHLGCHPDDDPSALLGVQVTIRQRNRGSARDRSP